MKGPNMHRLTAPVALPVVLAALLCALLAFTNGTALSTPAGAPAAPAHTYETPTTCLAASIDYVHIAGDPNSNTLWPAGLSARGTIYQLAGTAEHHDRSTNCSDSIAPLSYIWTVSYEDPNGVESDVTASLIGANSLQPSLHLANEGTYHFKLAEHTLQHVDNFTVSVFDPGYRWVNIGPNGANTGT